MSSFSRACSGCGSRKQRPRRDRSVAMPSSSVVQWHQVFFPLFCWWPYKKWSQLTNCFPFFAGGPTKSGHNSPIVSRFLLVALQKVVTTHQLFPLFCWWPYKKWSQLTNCFPFFLGGPTKNGPPAPERVPFFPRVTGQH